MAIDIGTGTTIAFATSNFAMNVRNIKWSGISRPAIKTSHLGTSVWDTFMCGDLTDPGTVVLECEYDAGAVKPPVTSQGPGGENITVTAPDANSAAAYGFVIDWGKEYPLEELMIAEVTVKFTGAITFTT